MHMPETMTDKIVPEIPTEAVPETAAPRSRTGFFSTAYSSPALLTEPISTGPVEDGSTAPSMKSEDPELPWLRINWEIKALVPIAFVLLGGMLLFLLATLFWRDPARHMGLLLAGAGAVAVCWGCLFVLLTYTAQRPMVKSHQKNADLGAGVLNVSVSFARRNDEIGDRALIS